MYSIRIALVLITVLALAGFVGVRFGVAHQAGPPNGWTFRDETVFRQQQCGGDSSETEAVCTCELNGLEPRIKPAEFFSTRAPATTDHTQAMFEVAARCHGLIH